MENLVTPLLNLGIGGVLLAVFLLFGHHLVTKLIPTLLERREADLAWARLELEKKRAEYLASLDKQHEADLKAMADLHKSYLEQLAKSETLREQAEKRSDKTISDLYVRLDRLEAALCYETAPPVIRQDARP
jgi:hypothetical protein